MNTDVLIRGFFSAIISLALSWIVFFRYDNEIGSENTGGEGQRYLPLVPGALLPIFIFSLAILEFFFYGAIPTARMTLSMCFQIFLHISLYYVVLIPALPFLRRHISARTCAMLWLIPNYLYITTKNSMQVPEPLIVIRMSGNVVWILFGIWFTGFLFVLLWKIVSHLWFRKQILKGAYPVMDEAVLDLYQQEIKDASMKKPQFQLVVSPNVSSPLTVGLFRRFMKVILPERQYSSDELRLIFRHEIIHIGREDSWSKFFLVFCTAMCWFNPLMWMAMRKSAEDMELSCDETVLLNTDEKTRRQYARLLLSTAGDERGFTTCLSAAASSMRYRLKSIVDPHKRRSGAIIVGLIFFILCMTCGYAALAYGDNTGEEVLFQCQEHSQFSIRSISLTDDAFHTKYVCVDQPAFNEYLARLQMDYLTGNYSFSENNRQFTYIYDAPQGTLGVVLSDHFIKLVPLYGEAPSASYYYLPQGVDWDYLDTLVIAYPAMNVSLKKAENDYGTVISATLDKLSVVESGVEKALYESDPDEVSGIFEHDHPKEAALFFSQKPAAPLTVEIESWDHASSYTLIQDKPENPFVLSLPAYPAHYRVYGDFLGENRKLYKAQFRFDIGEIDSQ